MDVYLIPSGRSRYDLYCEVATPVDAEGPATTWWGRLTKIFRDVLAEGEAIRRGPETVSTHGRVRRWFSHKLAEAVAEQRLLWHLRGADVARLVHPDDITAAQAVEFSRRILKSDRDKHRRWLLIDGALVLISTPVAVLPGPNVLAYYFIFRTVGHFLSMRGAQQGMTRLSWRPDPSRPLTELRAALALDVEARAQRVQDIASTLGLDHLAPFVDEAKDEA